jgi:hypothetical protein
MRSLAFIYLDGKVNLQSINLLSAKIKRRAEKMDKALRLIPLIPSTNKTQSEEHLMAHK